MTSILVVEDDQHIAELLKINLTEGNQSVTCVADGGEGYISAMETSYDLIILDLMLPGMNGVDVCRELRSNKNKTPILMLTSKSDEIDKIIGLEMGADDYMTKPFSIRELQARVKAILRRRKMDVEAPQESEVKDLHFNGLTIEGAKRRIELNGDRISLTPKEFDLLCLLASNAGKTYSRSQLLNLVWGQEFNGYEHTVNSHINRLRSKIERDPNAPEFILTTWGVGYRFNDEL